jgi:hypothetical protein
MNVPLTVAACAAPAATDVANANPNAQAFIGIIPLNRTNRILTFGKLSFYIDRVKRYPCISLALFVLGWWGQRTNGTIVGSALQAVSEMLKI